MSAGFVSAGFASADPGAARYAPGSFEAVDQAIESGAGAAFSFLERLVAAPSIVGHEAQEIVAAELARLGFGVTEIPIPPDTAARPPGGVAPLSYDGRYDVLGRVNPGVGPSLLLNGHVDVVPAQEALWSGDPFAPAVTDGWMTGRGAGDMKGGFAMALLAIGALRTAMPGALTGELSFLSVIEEECTGNGTLAAGQAPGQARLGVRVGYPRDRTPEEAFERVRDAVLGRPALAYGPTARNIHGADEAVELANIVAGARTLARFIARYFAAGGLPGEPDVIRRTEDRGAGLPGRRGAVVVGAGP